MALIRWEPAREISSIQNEMNRLFNTFFDTPTSNGGTGPARRWVPAMDLVEAENEFVLKADLPGLSQENVSIEVEDNVLTLSTRSARRRITASSGPSAASPGR
jgi:HSP20 family protein